MNMQEISYISNISVCVLIKITNGETPIYLIHWTYLGVICLHLHHFFSDGFINHRYPVNNWSLRFQLSSFSIAGYSTTRNTLWLYSLTY